MNKFSPWLMAGSLSLAANTAQAEATAYALLDASTINLLPVTGDAPPVFTLTPFDTYFYSEVDGLFDQVLTPVSSATGSIENSSVAIADASVTSSYALAETGSWAYADTYNYVELEMSGSGSAVLTIDYLLSVEYDAGDYAFTAIDLFMGSFSGSQYYSASVSLSEYYYEALAAVSTDSAYADTDSGTLGIYFEYEEGDIFYIDAYTYAEASTAAPVPLPAPILLLGSALLGLFTIRIHQS